MVATHQKSVAAQDVCRQPTGDKAIPTSHPPRPATLTRPASFLSATRAPRGRCHSPDPRILAGAPAWSVPTLEYKQAGLSSGAKASARAPSARQAKLRPAATIGCRAVLSNGTVACLGCRMRLGSGARPSACALRPWVLPGKPAPRASRRESEH